jgi:hypothetical protein
MSMYLELYKFAKNKKHIIFKINKPLMDYLNICYIFLKFSKIRNDKIAIGSKESMFFLSFHEEEFGILCSFTSIIIYC